MKRSIRNFSDKIKYLSGMRRLQAIALTLLLLTAPLAMVAQGASLAHKNKQIWLNAQTDDCAHVPLGICGCQRGPMESLGLLAPMPDMVLPRAVQLPALTIQGPTLRSSGFVDPPGYAPVMFHPPRG